MSNHPSPRLLAAGIPRRTFLFGASAAIGLLAAGCGDDDDAAAPSSQTGGEAGGAGDAAPYPVTIEHMHGSTTIDQAPKRVFAAGLTDIDPILALGVVPVGFIDWYGEYPAADIRNGLWPWAHELGEGKDMTVLPRNNDEFNFEAIAALQPDLIIAQYSGMEAADYATMSEIAPVVAQSKDFPLYQTPWDVTTRIIGEALGRSERADELIAQVEADFDAIRTAHPEFEGKTAVIADHYEGIIYVRGPEEPHGKVLAQMGFGYPDEIAEQIPADKVLAELSLEQIGLLDSADVVILGGDDRLPELTGSPVFKALDIVGQGRVVPGEEPVNGALYWASVLSLPFAIEHLGPRLAAGVDGDQATEIPAV